jgi:hypothetical protein
VRNYLLKPVAIASTPAPLWRHTGRMSNIDKQQINRWLGINAWTFAAVVGLLMAFSIANMARGLAEREAETTISR